MNIVHVLAQLDSLEWYGAPATNMFNTYPDLIEFPPVVVWRYVTRDERLIQKIGDAISTFEGDIIWVFDPTHHRNLVLRPSRVQTREDQTRLKESEPEYGIQANQELPLLAEHIFNFFGLEESKIPSSD